MMIKKIVPSFLAIAVIALAQKSHAQTNLLPVTFNAVCTSSTSNGLTSEKVTGLNLIDDCAFEHGLTNLNGLSLVFNPTNFSVQVVDTNGAALCTSLALSGGLTFTNTPATNSVQTASNATTQIVFQREVTVDTNSSVTGVASGTATWKGTNMSSFRLKATLLYTEPATGTNAAEICHAVLTAGGDRDGDDDDEGNEHHGPGNHRDNGNHLGWQNPHNPHNGR